jgi:hypothetical protein
MCRPREEAQSHLPIVELPQDVSVRPRRRFFALYAAD